MSDHFYLWGSVRFLRTGFWLQCSSWTRSSEASLCDGEGNALTFRNNVEVSSECLAVPAARSAVTAVETRRTFVSRLYEDLRSQKQPSRDAFSAPVLPLTLWVWGQSSLFSSFVFPDVSLFWITFISWFSVLSTHLDWSFLIYCVFMIPSKLNKVFLCI